MPVRVGFPVPRRLGNPSAASAPSIYQEIVRFPLQAESLGLDSVWFPDHFYYEWPTGGFEPYHEA
jgi:alkanesulfonate monooxygenase SsuD/methylene tetrahydromethanopterin reductase-like flavin-dependent oxidoreductase (luciferase family)